MKKLLTMLVILSLMATLSISAYAEEIDLSGYSDSELLALLDQVQNEVVARHIEKVAQLTAGTYIGGRDIPAGSYVLTSAGAEGDSGIVSLSSVNDSEDDWPSKLYEFERATDNYSVYITVEEGDTLVVPYPYTLMISGGIMFK